MVDPVIRIEQLSKRYQIGASQASYSSLRESIMQTAKAPLRRLHHQSGSNTDSNTIWALKDVSFGVQQGEVLGIIGRNGAGKSTLLKILSRITRPTEGKVFLRGRVGSLLEVGTGFHAELTGRENIYLNGAVLGMRRVEIQRKFDEIVDFAEIEQFLDTPVKHYSSGMYMRLAFAVAAHLEPEILLVDEVLAVGDAAFQKKCLGKMGEVATEGRTVLFVSHNMAAMHALCKVGVVFDHGRVSAIKPIGEAIYYYQNIQYSAEKMKEITGVELLNARITSSTESSVLTSDSPVVAETELFTDQYLENCYLNFVIEDTEGRYIIHSRTDSSGVRPSFSPGIHRVAIDIPRVSLRSGVYAAWFRLYVDNRNITRIVDSQRIMLQIEGPQVGGIVDLPLRWTWTRTEN